MDPVRPAGAAGGSSSVEPLYTLSEVAVQTGISLADLDRYRRRHGDRVPSVELGETRRYPPEALVVFRTLHRERAASASPSHGGRRLMSLTAQRRGREPEPRERELPSNGGGVARERAAAPGAADDDAPRSLAAPPHDPPALAARRDAPPATNGAESRDPLPLPAEGAAVEEAEPAEVVARSGAGPVPPPSRPARPLFTLQQVHEHTGIPYPTLAFYAAAHSDAVPAVGERYAKLYPWEAMGAFSRLHAERTPGWAAPDLAPPDSVEAWRRDDGIAGRLEQLQRTQDRLADELDDLLRDLAGPLTGFARYAEQVG